MHFHSVFGIVEAARGARHAEPGSERDRDPGFARREAVELLQHIAELRLYFFCRIFEEQPPLLARRSKPLPQRAAQRADKDKERLPATASRDCERGARP